MKNKYFDLLEELYNNYDISGGTSLNKFIQIKYGKDPGDYPTAIHLKKIFETLASKGLITWDAEPQEEKGNSFKESEKYKGLLGTKDDEKYQTFKEIYVEVHLTPEGLDYVEDLMDRKATRESLLSTNSSMKLLTGLLLLVGAIGITVQIKQCCISQQQLRLQSKPQLPNTLSFPKHMNNPKFSTVYEVSDTSSSEHSNNSLNNRGIGRKMKDTPVIKLAKKP